MSCPDLYATVHRYNNQEQRCACLGPTSLDHEPVRGETFQNWDESQYGEDDIKYKPNRGYSELMSKTARRKSYSCIVYAVLGFGATASTDSGAVARDPHL